MILNILWLNIICPILKLKTMKAIAVFQGKLKGS